MLPVRVAGRGNRRGPGRAVSRIQQARPYALGKNSGGRIPPTAAANSASPPSTTVPVARKHVGATRCSRRRPERCLPSLLSSCGARLPTDLLKRLSRGDVRSTEASRRHCGASSAPPRQRPDASLLHDLNVGRRPERPHRGDLGVLVERHHRDGRDLGAAVTGVEPEVPQERRLAASDPQFGEFGFFLGVLEPCVELTDGGVAAAEVRSDRILDGGVGGVKGQDIVSGARWRRARDSD